MKRKRIRMLTMVLLAAFSITLVLPLVGNAAPAVNLDKKCTLTVYSHSVPVNAEKDEMEDLNDAAIVVDLYRVAKAVPNAGYDGYHYEMLGNIYADGLPLEYISKLTSQTEIADIKSSDLEILSQAAARLALYGDGKEGDTTAIAQWKDVVATGVRITGNKLTDADGNPLELDAGLYLMIARGENLKNVESYAMTTEDSATGEERLVTVAYTENNGYTFAPSLIALPTKDAYEGEINTGNPGEWIYDAVMYLKPQRIPYGDLRIIKNLPVYENSDEALFVFDVEAVLNGRVVYSDVISINFTAPGTQEVVIKRLPVDAKVTVTEVYSGAVYVPDPQNPSAWIVPGPGGADNPGIITSNDTVTIEFTNIYDERRTGGHGITNHFYYDFTGPGAWEVNQEMTRFDQAQNNPNNPAAPENPDNNGNQGNTDDQENAGTQGDNDVQGTIGSQENQQPYVDQEHDNNESAE